MKDRNSRQSFLGDHFDEIMKTTRIGLVGLGGGGSIIVTSLAHYGFKKYFVADPDLFEESNLNRLLGSGYEDIALKIPKVDIAERQIRKIIPDADIVKAQNKWQFSSSDPAFLECEIIFSCLDDFATRMQIESFTRKHGIILIDIGLSIKSDSAGRFYCMGQVVMSHPDGPCFKCLDFITDKDLELEATRYGQVGIRPQVISANSILGNTAVSLAVELLSNWTGASPVAFYKHFDGNFLDMSNNLKLESKSFQDCKCKHF